MSPRITRIPWTIIQSVTHASSGVATAASKDVMAV
jgi:hypothetical protein